MSYLVSHPDVAAAFLSAIATGLAVLATWRGPIAAARLAETMRERADQSAERRRTQMIVFTVLMQERATTFSPEAVKALNLVDVAFLDCRPVRDAWAELYRAFSSATPDQTVVDDRLRSMLKLMAAELNLAHEFRPDDFSRVYYPRSVAEEMQLKVLERRYRLGQLMGSAAAGNAAPSAPGPFPPQP